MFYNFFIIQDTRTTGAAEAFNGKCGKAFKTHGNLFDFLNVFQKVELLKATELERDVDGLIQNDTRKKKFRDRSMKIEFFSKQLRDDKISAKRFMKLMANMDNKIIFDESEYPALELDDLEFDSVQSQEHYKQIIENSDKDDTTPTIMRNNADDSETVVVIRSAESNRAQENTKTILTRSKKRKLDKKKDEEHAVNTPVILIQSSETPTMTNDCSSDSDLEEATVRQTRSKNRRIDNATEIADDLDDVTSLTRSTQEVFRLHEKFNKIVNNQDVISSKSKDTKCVMGCQRDKCTVLLPCKHQPTCKQCFVMWKIFVCGKQMECFCPVCRENVIEQINIQND